MAIKKIVDINKQNDTFFLNRGLKSYMTIYHNKIVGFSKFINMCITNLYKIIHPISIQTSHASQIKIG